jgi:ADP-ribose pyrophosphatase YjhB (NUDIX family)
MDLTFRTEGGKFNYRVGAIIINEGKILMVKNSRASYYYSVGGRVKFNETCDDAILREVKEELGVNMEIDYLAYFHENLFDDKDTHEHFHEIALFYVMKPIMDWEKIVCSSFVEEDREKEFLEWIPIEKLSEYTAYPTFFASELKILRGELKHITEIRNHRK